MRLIKLIIENTYSHKKTEFDIDHRGLSLIVGANGAGKSSIMKSLLFCLFGIGADDVINETVGNNACVTLIGTRPYNLPSTADSDVNVFYGEEFTVRRYRKHKKHKNNLHFFIANEPVAAPTNIELQKKMEKYLGLDYRAFLNIATFSHDTLMFCSATDTERKAIFEKILQDLDVYNEYYQQAKEEQQALMVEVGELKHQVEIEERELSVVKKVLEVEKQRELELEVRRQDKLDGLNEELKELELKFDTCLKLRNRRLRIQRAVGQLDGWLDEHPFQEDEFFKLNQDKYNLDYKLATVIESDKCDQCNQGISEEHRKKERKRLQDLLGVTVDVLIEFERRKEIRQKVTDKFNELNEKSEGLRYKLTKYDGVQDKIKECKKDIEKLEKDLDTTSTVKEWSSKVKRLSKKISSYSRKIKEHEEALVYLDEVTMGFSKQGIPNIIIARALHHLGERANHYLDILTNGTIGIRLSGFSLTKKGAVRNKIGIEVISPSGVKNFGSYSGGERQRLNIALLLALRDVAEFNRGVELNCLFLDEVLDLSLDEQGIEDVTVLLHNKKKSIDSIFVISPKDNLLQNTTSEFDNVIRVVKEGGFSKVV